MAEVYGVKPKMFTKEWWPYFWMYYKWQTIGIVAIIAMVAITAVQCSTREKYDVTVTYAGAAYMDAETTDKLEAALEEYVTDIDGNGEKNVFVQQLTMSASGADAQMDMAMNDKHTVSLMEDTYHLYIYDKAQAEIMIGRKHSDETYTPVGEWYGRSFDDSMVIKSESGVPLALSLKDSTFMQDNNINSDEMYLAIKQCNKDKEENVQSYESAVAMADAMMR